MVHEVFDRNADQVTADEIRRERAEQDAGEQRVEHDAETPAQPRAQRGAESDSNESVECHGQFNVEGMEKDSRESRGCGPAIGITRRTWALPRRGGAIAVIYYFFPPAHHL